MFEVRVSSKNLCRSPFSKYIDTVMGFLPPLDNVETSVFTNDWDAKSGEYVFKFESEESYQLFLLCWS